MSWDQTYSVPSVEDLLIQLTGKNIRELLEKELNAQGLKIEKVESITLGTFYGDIYLDTVILSDGRVFEPKLVREETADGNWGRTVYEYRLRGEQVEVGHLDLSEHENNCDSACDYCCDEPGSGEAGHSGCGWEDSGC